MRMQCFPIPRYWGPPDQLLILLSYKLTNPATILNPASLPLVFSCSSSSLTLSPSTLSSLLCSHFPPFFILFLPPLVPGPLYFPGDLNTDVFLGSTKSGHPAPLLLTWLILMLFAELGSVFCFRLCAGASVCLYNNDCSSFTPPRSRPTSYSLFKTKPREKQGLSPTVCKPIMLFQHMQG